MPRSLLIILVFSLCSATLYAQHANAPPPAVKRILDKAVVEVKKNRQEFVKANKRPLGDARVELQDLSAKLIRDGKTVDATAVLKQIETLEADVMNMANTPAPLPAPLPAVPQRPLLERMAGRWNRSNDPSYWVIERDGRAGCRNLQTHRPCHPDSKASIIDEETAEIVWPTGVKWRIKMAGNDVLAVHETENGKILGDGLALTRHK